MAPERKPAASAHHSQAGCSDREGVFSLSWTHAYLKPRSAAGALIDGGMCARATCKPQRGVCNTQRPTCSMQQIPMQHAATQSACYRAGLGRSSVTDGTPPVLSGALSALLLSGALPGHAASGTLHVGCCCLMPYVCCLLPVACCTLHIACCMDMLRVAASAAPRPSPQRCLCFRASSAPRPQR